MYVKQNVDFVSKIAKKIKIYQNLVEVHFM